MRPEAARSILFVLIVLGLSAWAPRAAADDKPPAEKPKPSAAERVWQGYLWKDDQGRLRIGWPVIAMGVLAEPAHVLDVKGPARFKPLLAPTADSHIFWNYRLEEEFAKCLPKLPKALVRVRGSIVTTDTDGSIGFGSGSGTYTMKSPRVLSIEFVSDAWLKAWAPIFREPWSPWRIRDRPRGDAAAGARRLAPRLVEVLKAMRAVPGATAQQKALAARVDPAAVVVSWFRTEKESDILRWIHATNEKHALGLKGLDALGQVPPMGTELQRWFVKAPTRKSFIERVRTVWKGELAVLQLPYYVSEAPGSIRWTRTPLTVVAAWSAEEFLAHQKLTRDTLKR